MKLPRKFLFALAAAGIFGLGVLTGVFLFSGGGNQVNETAEVVSAVAGGDTRVSDESIAAQIFSALAETFQNIFSGAPPKPTLEINIDEPPNVSGQKNNLAAIAADISPVTPTPSLRNSTRLKISSSTSKKNSRDEIAGSASAESISRPEKNISENESLSSPIISIQASPPPANSKGNEEKPRAASANNISTPTCSFASNQESNHKIIFNEVAWMGGQESPSDEWLELKNNYGQLVVMQGWQIASEDEKLEILFSRADSVPENGFYLLERSDDGSVPNISADKIYTGALSNSGERLKLFDQNCILVDEVNAGSGWGTLGGDSAIKKTLERNIANFDWHTSANPGGTPKARNSGGISQTAVVPNSPAPSPPPAGNPAPSPESSSLSLSPLPSSSPSPSSSSSALSTSPTQPNSSAPVILLISEVMAGLDSSSSYEFVELYNPGLQAIDLTGWSLVKKSSSGTTSTLLTASRQEGFRGKTALPGKHFLAVNEGGYSGTVPSDATWATSNTLAYTNNGLILYNASGTKVDETSWTEIPKSQSWVRQSWTTDQFLVQAIPTPQNSSE